MAAAVAATASAAAAAAAATAANAGGAAALAGADYNVAIAQQARNIGSMLVKRWARVED